MWIMTPFGALSVVHRPPKSIQRGDSKVLQVRARDRVALDYLRRNFMGRQLTKTMSTPERDYQFRAYCTPEAFADAVSRMILEINYENFKDAVIDDDLHDMYLRIWSTMYTHYERSRNRRRRNWKIT